MEWQKVESKNNATWKFKEQKEIEGIFISMKEKVGQNESCLYTLKTKDGEVGVWGSTLLDDRFTGIDLGEEVKIVYQGLQKNKNGSRSFHAFDVYHRPKPDNSEVKIEEIPF